MSLMRCDSHAKTQYYSTFGRQTLSTYYSHIQVPPQGTWLSGTPYYSGKCSTCTAQFLYHTFDPFPLSARPYGHPRDQPISLPENALLYFGLADWISTPAQHRALKNIFSRCLARRHSIQLSATLSATIQTHYMNPLYHQNGPRVQWESLALEGCMRDPPDSPHFAPQQD